MVCIWLLTTNGFAQNTIKGDGNIITKEISISDYDEISYVGKVNIKYEQSNASPFFKITIDENILPHLDIKIKGKTLIIQPKNEKKYFTKAIDAGLMDEVENGYEWLHNKGMKASLGYFLHKVFNPNGTARIPYRFVESLFNESRLDRAIDQALIVKQPQKWRKEIDTLFDD